MTEEVSASAVAGQSAGALLRQAREQAGLHLDSLAGALKVPPRQLDALEQDRLDLLPDVVFARALASSVCRNLKLDPRTVLDKLPHGGESRLGRDEPINVPFRVPGESAGGPLRAKLMRPPVLAAIALLVAALLVWWLPGFAPSGKPQGVAGEAPAAAAAPAPEPAPLGAPAGQAAEPVVPAGAIPVAPAGAIPVVPAPSPAVSAPAAPGHAAAGAVSIEFHAAQPSWVHVADADSRVPLRRTLQAGESVSVSGAAPLAVTVGSARAVRVSVQGRPFDLTPLARDNVARFEVR